MYVCSYIISKPAFVCCKYFACFHACNEITENTIYYPRANLASICVCVIGLIEGSHELKDHMDRNEEMKVIDKYLVPDLEKAL